MRYGPIAESLLEERANEAAAGPRVPMDVLLAPVQAKAIMICTRLGVLERLRESPRTLDELAGHIDADREMLGLLLRVLCGSGYVTRASGRYDLSPFGRKALLSGTPGSRRAHVIMCELFWDALGQMDSALRTGRGVDAHHYLREPSAWAAYQEAMLEDARITARLVAPLVPVRSGARKLLDIGGSHGLYAAAVCRAHPPLRAEVIDLPQAIEQARSLAISEGLTDVVTHRAANALTDDLGSDNDVILLSNILHHLSGEDSRELLVRVRRALAVGGTTAIWEFAPPDENSAPDIMSDGTALFFRAISAGRCHSADEYVAWLESAGFSGVRVRRSALTPHHIVVTGFAGGARSA